ncbi:low molecular weight phosphatase family protein [Serinicoccus kebangsaanensis]|uniref:arsenate reductase/protein-tyrosine-phosphatase family protein n=1 Tax=Serinicoccus kebangsaanensis TaxID=2602069 RepID=UPI00124C2659|nr:low molecular weight phosphatase family protein [Serinicoccus kebangsaanensis]
MSTPTVLTVCTGNVCRSPLLERLLQRGVDRSHGAGRIEVRSAGTRALVGSGMDERSARLLVDLGGDHEGFRARRLTEEIVSGASLVLAATPEHRSAVVQLHPRALRRTFTVQEFAHLVQAIPDDDLPSWDDPGAALERLTERARQARAGATRAVGDGLVDPFRQSDAVYDELRQQVSEVLPPLSRALGC